MALLELLKRIEEETKQREESLVKILEVELPLYYEQIIGDVKISARINAIDTEEGDIDYDIIGIENNLQGLMTHTPCIGDINYLDIFFQGMIEELNSLGVFELN
jgi:hypothetical protein